MATIAVVGTLDTKGTEHAYVAEVIRDLGHTPVLIDVGPTDQPQVPPDVRVSAIVPTFDAPMDRGACVAQVADAASLFVSALAKEGRIDGVVSMGGGGGTSIGTAIMRALPIGLPKVMVSTLASGNTAHYVGTSDITMMPSIVDVAGLNRVSRTVFTSAARAVCAMAQGRNEMVSSTDGERPLIVASMFGNTTDCVGNAQAALENCEFEVLVFHATGTGGQTMETLIASGMVSGILDITTTEIADEIVGGVLTAGPNRLDAGSAANVPTVVVPGCVDMVNFGERATVPEKFRDRLFYQHNEQVTLMRTSPEENRAIAEFMARKLNRYTTPPTVLLPLGGVSVISEPGGPFHDPEADAALFATLKSQLDSRAPVLESPHAINHPEFAQLCAQTLLQALRD